jgi:hypothetical protein
MTQSKKRFIAGAVCPKCSAMDRIVMYRIDDKDYRECVDCGFSDVMHFSPKTQELETRVNTPEAVKEAQTQVIKFVTPGDKH